MDDSQMGGAASGAATGFSLGGPWGALAGGVLGFLGSEKTNEANSAQSQAQMDFQREMSNTAYQRAVADMKAAGLNPMLAYSQGGASTPGGAQAVMQNSSAAGVSAAMAVRQGDLTEAQTAKTKAETINTVAEAEARIAELRAREKGGLSSAAHTDELARRARAANEGHIGSHEADVVRQRAGESYYQYLKRRREYLSGEPDSDYRDPDVSLTKAHERALTARAINEEFEHDRYRGESGYWRDVGKHGVYAEKGSEVLGRIAHSAASVGLRLPRVFNDLTIYGKGSISRSGRSGSW